MRKWLTARSLLLSFGRQRPFVRMQTAEMYIRWFVLGMGSVLGISQAMPRAAHHKTMDAIGGDFRAVGNDLRTIIRKHPATPEVATQLGEATQLKLKGLG